MSDGIGTFVNGGELPRDPNYTLIGGKLIPGTYRAFTPEQLAERDRQVAEKAWDEGAYDHAELVGTWHLDRIANPYRQEGRR